MRRRSSCWRVYTSCYDWSPEVSAYQVKRGWRMRALVSPGKAWFCTVLSAFGVVILSFIGYLFNTNHESMMGSTNDPTDGKAVAHTVFWAAGVYLAFFVFCGSQILVYKKQSRITL